MDKISALIVFPSLSSIAWTLLSPNLQAARPVLREQCQPSAPGPNYLPVTGKDGFDRFLCVLVSLFHVGLEPENSPFMIYLFATCIPAATLFMTFESSRKGRRFVASYTALFGGMLGQVMTFAVVLPFYWLFFALFGRRNTRKITQAHAEAALFGVLLGWVTPSIALFTMTDPGITAMFQIAPVLSFVLSTAHLTVRSPTTYSGSGFRTIQFSYIVSFLVASCTHIHTLSTFSSIGDMQAFFLPTLFATSTPAAIMNVFQVDLLIIAATWVFGSLWFANNSKDACFLALWALVGSVIVGPGATFIAAALWRESQLESALPVEVQPKVSYL